MKKFTEVKQVFHSKEVIEKIKEHFFKTHPNISEEVFNESLKKESEGKVFKNDIYQVIIHEAEVSPGFPEMIWLSIRRLDREPVKDWRDMQTIKNELVGQENEGVELYPAESFLVDTSNQYHMWVFKDSNLRFPFGMRDGRYISDEPGIEGTNIKQRKL